MQLAQGILGSDKNFGILLYMADCLPQLTKQTSQAFVCSLFGNHLIIITLSRLPPFLPILSSFFSFNNSTSSTSTLLYRPRFRIQTHTHIATEQQQQQ